MGVSGCGKTSVGQALSDRCDVTFIDGDDLHPQANIDKMAGGQPLTDADRAPWLRSVGIALRDTSGSVVIGCSALKRSYRDIIRKGADEQVAFLHLDAKETVLQARVAKRDAHFMPPDLLQSQFDTLERLAPDELGTQIDIAKPFADVVGQSERYIKEMTI
jgi:gluconokinase/shikimate kinase